MTYKTLAKICLAISGSSIAYMFLITYEGTNFGWTVFFVFLAFSILFHALDEKEEEIATLRSPKEDSEEWKKYIEKRREIEADPRSGDPFYISDNFNPNYQKLMGEKKLKEKNSSQNQNVKDSPKQKIEKSEIQFIPTLYPGMEKQWGKPKTAEQLLEKSPKQAPPSNEPLQEKQPPQNNDKK